MTGAEDAGGPIEVGAEVFEGIEAVRRSGLTNMLDWPAVAEIAEAIGCGAAPDEFGHTLTSLPALLLRLSGGRLIEQRVVLPSGLCAEVAEAQQPPWVHG